MPQSAVRAGWRLFYAFNAVVDRSVSARCISFSCLPPSHDELDRMCNQSPYNACQVQMQLAGVCRFWLRRSVCVHSSVVVYAHTWGRKHGCHAVCTRMHTHGGRTCGVERAGQRRQNQQDVYRVLLCGAGPPAWGAQIRCCGGLVPGHSKQSKTVCAAAVRSGRTQFAQARFLFA